MRHQRILILWLFDTFMWPPKEKLTWTRMFQKKWYDREPSNRLSIFNPSLLKWKCRSDKSHVSPLKKRGDAYYDCLSCYNKNLYPPKPSAKNILQIAKSCGECYLLVLINCRGRHPYPLCRAYRQMDYCWWVGQALGR